MMYIYIYVVNSLHVIKFETDRAFKYINYFNIFRGVSKQYQAILLYGDHLTQGTLWGTLCRGHQRNKLVIMCICRLNNILLIEP